MDTEQLIEQTRRLIERARGQATGQGVYAEACQFLKTCGGSKNEFLSTAQTYKPREVGDSVSKNAIRGILESFLNYLEAGLHQELGPERRAQIDVVSDFLEQANNLLETSGVHPAAPAVLIGASLEEFVRNWVEAEGLDLGGKKPGLDTYAKVLREAELIGKQDIKDITAWGGLRNHAAHGHWDEVGDEAKVSLMLQGVNLFMRKYGA